MLGALGEGTKVAGVAAGRFASRMVGARWTPLHPR